MDEDAYEEADAAEEVRRVSSTLNRMVVSQSDDGRNNPSTELEAEADDTEDLDENRGITLTATLRLLLLLLLGAVPTP